MRGTRRSFWKTVALATATSAGSAGLGAAWIASEPAAPPLARWAVAAALLCACLLSAGIAAGGCIALRRDASDRRRAAG